MTPLYEIRADHDRDTVVVYQAYNDAIADAALKAQAFVAPFSFQRMSWLKPSFAWMMHRSQWGQKKGQERTLRLRITRAAWDEALAQAVLTSPDGPVFGDAQRWARDFAQARVHVQWDTERSLTGAPLGHYSIQVGLSRHLLHDFAERWIVSIEDFSPTVAKARQWLRQGKKKEASRLLPTERPYPWQPDSARRLQMTR